MGDDPAFELPPQRLEERFADKAPLLSATEALFEASRCLYCHDAPCIPSCPTAIDIPTFIRKIGTGNFAGAARTILSANLLGDSCSRVCPVEVLCESTCVYEVWGRPAIPIGRLQRYALERGAAGVRFERAPRTGKSIGLLGAGPASLACAGTLALLGHEPIIYEKRALPGGLNSTGVAPYKMQLVDAIAEVEFVRTLGVEIRTGVEIGRDVSADDLLQQHAAVFLGPGLGKDSRLGVPGEDGPGVTGATAWIERIKTDPSSSVDGVRAAIVVGGGNTAIDATRELRGLGVAEVSLVYRRSEAEMPGYAHELAGARREGVTFVENAAVAEVLRNGSGDVTGVRLVATEGGRPTSRDRGQLAAQLVVMAIGQDRPRELAALFPGVECDDRGCISADAETGVTGNPRIFAGGDARNGGREVVHAVAEGQRAAHAIDALLRSEPDA